MYIRVIYIYIHTHSEQLTIYLYIYYIEIPESVEDTIPKDGGPTMPVFQDNYEYVRHGGRE